MELAAAIVSVLGVLAVPQAQDINLNGASLGSVEIDPHAFGVAIGRRFLI
jgi:hypothetical protein